MLNHRETRLSLFCGHVIEACWLVALVVAPLFFNVYSSRIFDPDKVALVRTIGLIMGLAWVIRGLELWTMDSGRRTGGSRLSSRAFGLLKRASLETTFVLPLALLFLIDLAAATAISVSPRVSLWGSYPRLQGLYTTSAYVLIFVSILALLRSREQMDRLITTALVVSLPVALYGIIQYFGTDPLTWGSDVTVRVASSMGNPLFVGAFLIMIVPLTLYRLLVAGGAASDREAVATSSVLLIGGAASLAFQMIAWREGPIAGTASAGITVASWLAVAVVLKKPVAPFLRIGGHTVLLSAQLMCLLFSQSRGPWLGLLAGLFLFALLWTYVQGRRRRSLSVIGGGLAALVLLVALNIPRSPLGFVRDVPYVGRIGLLSNVDAGSARVRVLIWEGVEDLLTDDPWRTLIGYGPETLYLVYPPHYPPELARLENRDVLPDRAHNETFDVLVRTGVLGFVIYLLLFTSLFYHGLKWIGIVRTRSARAVFLSLWFGGGATAVLLALMIDDSWRFAGLALPVGLLTGMFIYVGVAALRPHGDESLDAGDRTIRLIGVTFLAILVAHFVEIQLGLAVTATRTYFWIFAAVLVACRYIVEHRRALLDDDDLRVLDPEGSGAYPASGVQDPALVADTFQTASLRAGSMIVGCSLVTLVYDFPFLSGGVDLSWSITWLLGFTWVAAGLVVIAGAWPSDHTKVDSRHLASFVATYAVISVSCGLVYVAVHWGVFLLDAGPAILLLTYFVAMILLIMVLGGLLHPARSPAQWEWNHVHCAVYAALATGIFAASYYTNVNPIRADVYYKEAYQLRAVARYEESGLYHRKAISFAPNQDLYYLSFAKTLMERAALSADPMPLFEDAERLLSKARTLAPLSPDHAANLARLYRSWAERTENVRLRKGRLNRALDLFRVATNLSPKSAQTWNDLAATHVLAGDTTTALRIYIRSLDLDEGYFETHLHLGRLYFAQKRWREAANAYRRVIELEPGHGQARLALAAAKAEMKRSLGAANTPDTDRTGHEQASQNR